jgi:hypothetical protein
MDQKKTAMNFAFCTILLSLFTVSTTIRKVKVMTIVFPNFLLKQRVGSWVNSNGYSNNLQYDNNIFCRGRKTHNLLSSSTNLHFLESNGWKVRFYNRLDTFVIFFSAVTVDHWVGKEDGMLNLRTLASGLKSQHGLEWFIWVAKQVHNNKLPCFCYTLLLLALSFTICSAPLLAVHLYLPFTFTCRSPLLPVHLYMSYIFTCRISNNLCCSDW